MIEEKLYSMQDKQYRDFQSKLIPNINKDSFIGVRTPCLRKLAKELVKNGEYLSFLNELPHNYFDENQLHAFIISEIKDFDECLKVLNEFLPYVDNWATCDQMSPKVFKNNRNKLINEIKKWLVSDKSYVIRFAIGMLMAHFLEDNFDTKYSDMVANIKSDDYYVNMMRSWYFATALAKKYEKVIIYIERGSLDKWTHNKTIQKCIESNRISNKQKEYLRNLKM